MDKELPMGNLSKEYEELLQEFGKHCIDKLKEDKKLYFTNNEIAKIVPESMRNNRKNVIMGFLVKTNVEKVEISSWMQINNRLSCEAYKHCGIILKVKLDSVKSIE